MDAPFHRRAEATPFFERLCPGMTNPTRAPSPDQSSVAAALKPVNVPGTLGQHRKRKRDMGSDLIRTSVSNGIVELMLDRAPVNALSMPLIDALLTALAEA